MQLTRRNLLRNTALAGAGLATAALATACSQGTDGGSGAGSGGVGGDGGQAGAVALPNYLPYTGVKPDAPATESGAAPYFRTFPSDPPQFTTDKPLSGGSVSLLTFMNLVPSPVGENAWWQGINEALGGELTMSGAAVGDYPSKFQTVVAGGDIPDLAVIMPGTVPEVGKLLEAKFQDLSEHLSGDAIKDYPALANIPTTAWRGCVFNNGIYTIPIHRFSLQRTYIVRTDLTEKYGVNPQPNSGEELLALLKGLTNADEGRFATAHAFGLLDMVKEMHGAPNDWAVDDQGVFTKDYEAEEFKESLAVMQQIWKDKLVHPNGFQDNISLQIQGFFNSGVTSLMPASAGWASNAEQAVIADPKAETKAIELKTWEGSEPAGRWLNSGAPYLTAVRAAEPDRIREVLGVVNWLAAPWGTKEYLQFKHGVEGVDYEVGSDGAIERTDKGKEEYPYGLTYGGSAAMVHYRASAPDLAKLEYDSEVVAMEKTVPLPNVGLWSKTDDSDGASLTRDMKFLQADIVQGRKSLSDWDAGVKNWRAKGGDKIREEYQNAKAEQG